MGLYTLEDLDFDYNTAELVLYYIDEYKMFKQQYFCFLPEYAVDDFLYKDKGCSTIKLKTKNNFINLFECENVNVKVLCGKNGSGKSTLLKIMAKPNEVEFEIKTLYLFRDKNGKFACTKECSLIVDEEPIELKCFNTQYEHDPVTWCVTYENMQIQDYSINKNMVKLYSEQKSLYDGVLENDLFTHFSVELWNFNNEIDGLLNGRRKELFNDLEINDLKLWLEDDFISFYLLHIYQDSDYDFVIELFKNNMRELNVDIQTLLTENVYESFAPQLVREIKNLQEKILHKDFRILDITKVEDLIQKLENKIFDYLSELKFNVQNSNFIALRPSELLYFRGYSAKTKPYRYFGDLSKGEQNSLIYRYKIFHSMSQKKGCWWYIDEPEDSLHPEWCRNFFYDYMNAYKVVKKYLIEINKIYEDERHNSEKRYNLIFATHSPFLLSDLTNDHVIYLEKENGKTKEIYSEKEIFAGNIGEMYNTSFFMQNTIGEFARSKIMEIINTINNNEKVSEDILSNWKLLVSKIGDDLLKNLLTDKIMAYEKNRLK